MAQHNATDEQIDRLICELWKRSTNDVVSVRVQPRSETELIFRSPGVYLTLESMRDPEDPGHKPMVFSPFWTTGSYKAELLGESMPFWIVAFPHSQNGEHYDPREVVRRLLSRPELWPDGQAILRWHVAAAT